MGNVLLNLTVGSCAVAVFAFGSIGVGRVIADLLGVNSETRASRLLHTFCLGAFAILISTLAAIILIEIGELFTKIY